MALSARLDVRGGSVGELVEEAEVMGVLGDESSAGFFTDFEGVDDAIWAPSIFSGDLLRGLCDEITLTLPLSRFAITELATFAAMRARAAPSPSPSSESEAGARSISAFSVVLGRSAVMRRVEAFGASGASCGSCVGSVEHA